MPEKLERCVTSVMNREDMRKRYPDEKERRSRAYAICTASTKKGGGMDYGYLIALDETTLDKPVDAMAVGTYSHPVYGEIDITPERLQRYADNVNAKVRGIDLDIDYEHKERDGKAAGWVQGAEVRDGHLWLTVDWTDPAKAAIKNKEYRYFSPEFVDEWKDAEGNAYEDVLFGGALTNRPFLKNLMPINFSEHVNEDKIVNLDEGVYKYSNTTNEFTVLREVPKPDSDGGEVKLDPKKLAEILGIEGDEEAIVTAVTELRTFRENATKDTEQAKKFAEQFPEIAQKMAEDATRLAELESSKRLMEADAKVKVWSEGQNALPAKVGDKARDFRQTLTADQAEMFDQVMGDIHSDGLIEVDGETKLEIDPTETDTAEKFEKEIATAMNENKDKEGFTYLDAVTLAEKRNPELAAAYRKLSV